MEFKDKVALVTGATSGIGKAIAFRFLSEGAKVGLIGIDDAQGAEVEKEMRNLADKQRAGDAIYLHADVSQPQQVRQAISTATSRWGKIDVIVNDAAIMKHAMLAELEDEDWDAVLGVNLRAVFLFIKYGVPHMPAGGSIVNISSVHAAATGAGSAPYAASKGGMEALTRAASIELFDKKIRVNAIRPGAIDTPMLWENPNVKSGAEKIMPEEVGKPENIADAVLFLSSERAAFVTGAVLNVDGGRLALLGSHAH